MRRLVLVAAAASASLFVPAAAAAATYHVYACGPWSSNAGPFASVTVPGTYANVAGCSGTDTGTGIELGAQGLPKVPNGQGPSWSATAPAGLAITHISTINDESYSVGDGQGWWGEFYWTGGAAAAGRSGQLTDSFHTYGCCQASLNNQTVGWFMACGWSSCGSPANITVGGVDLTVAEAQGPSLVAPTGLWHASGWVRGTWPFFAWGNSPSGLCSLSATLNGQLIDTKTSAKDTSAWHQCAAPPISQQVDTSHFGQGQVPLTLNAADAAGWPGASVTKTVYIDNSTPSISLSGPVDAPSTAGTQYVTASATGSPSGIAEIVCSVDGGLAQTFPGASAHVPVRGVGEHVVSCYAEDGAVDPAGVRGRSATASWSLKIGQPTELGIAFNKLVGLRCHRVRVRVRIPGRWVTVRRHGKPVKVKTRARPKVERVMRCHARTVRRRTVVFVRVRRHGHLVRVKRIKVVPVVVPPRLVGKPSRRIAFGHGAHVNGWLGTSSGTAIGGQIVHVLTAPDNGRDQFTQRAAVTTAANGTWTARLPTGPARVVEAVYDGDPTTESAFSGQVRLIVPAKVKLLSVTPRRVAWSGTVRITGQLVGGYLPAGGALVRLRIGQGSRYQTYGVQEHVTGNGRFTTAYTFGPGYAGIQKSYWFQIATLPMGNYPYAPAASRRRSVLVGGPPPPSGSHRKR